MRFFTSPTAFNSATIAKNIDYIDLAPGDKRSFTLPKLDIYFNSRVKPNSEFCFSLDLARSRPTLESLRLTMILDNVEIPLSLSNRHFERYHELLHQMPRFCVEKGAVLSDLVKANQIKIKIANHSESIDSVVRFPTITFSKLLESSFDATTETTLRFRLITINDPDIRAAMPFLVVFVFLNILLTYISYTIFSSYKSGHFAK